MQPTHEAAHAVVDDGLGLCHGGLAAGVTGLHQGCQVVHGVQVYTGQVTDFGFDVARYCQIDQQHGSSFALAHGALHGAQAD